MCRNPNIADGYCGKPRSNAKLENLEYARCLGNIMFRFFFVVTIIVFSMSCSEVRLQNASTNSPPIDFEPSASPIEVVSRQVESPDYPGRTIDQVFPIISDHDFTENDYKDRDYDVDALGYQVYISHLAPISVKKNSKTILRFNTRRPLHYWSILVGVSSLLDPKSKEIYVATAGPGAVCCTNYWITEISSGRLRPIFRSEEFGSFRGPMEIFDYDGDGAYELADFDSCFRYFMGDCGSCSPQPRVYFEFDRISHTYRPAPRIQEDFVRQSMQDSEKLILDDYEKIQHLSNANEKIALQYDFNRLLLDHVVQLLHLGEEKKGWMMFKRYGDDSDGRVKGEMLRRLAGCKFYSCGFGNTL